MVSLFIFLWFTYTDYFVIDENSRYNERTTGYMKSYRIQYRIEFWGFYPLI